MRIGRVRLRRTLVMVVVVILAVRLVTKFANRVRDGRRRSSASWVMSSSFTTDCRQLGDISAPNVEPELLGTVDFHVDYPVYIPSLPQFADDDDRFTFISDDTNRVYYTHLPVYQLVGRVRVFSTGFIRQGQECSWKTTGVEFDRLRDDEGSITYVNKTLCSLLVPDGQTFQHFVDGILPKVVQLMTEAPQLAAAVDQFVLYRPRDAIIYELLERIGINHERLMLVAPESSQVLAARHLVDTCVTPSLHPRLLRRASQLLQVCHCQDRSHCQIGNRCLCENVKQKERRGDRKLDDETESLQHHVELNITNATLANSSLIVLLSRRRARNSGRRMLNENAILEYLVSRFGRQRVVVFGNGRGDFASASTLFSQAAVVIGVHGGAFYNIIFAPAGCVVAEVMPVRVGHGQLKVPSRLAHTIFWRMADALGHIYWRLYVSTSSPRNDVTFPIDKLKSALISVN